MKHTTATQILWLKQECFESMVLHIVGKISSIRFGGWIQQRNEKLLLLALGLVFQRDCTTMYCRRSSAKIKIEKITAATTGRSIAAKYKGTHLVIGCCFRSVNVHMVFRYRAHTDILTHTDLKTPVSSVCAFSNNQFRAFDAVVYHVRYTCVSFSFAEVHFRKLKLALPLSFAHMWQLQLMLLIRYMKKVHEKFSSLFFTASDILSWAIYIIGFLIFYSVHMNTQTLSNSAVSEYMFQWKFVQI